MGKRKSQTLPNSTFSTQLDQASFLFLSKQAPNGRFDAFSLRAFVQRVLATVTAARVTGLVLQKAKGCEEKSWRFRLISTNNEEHSEARLPSQN